MTLSDLKKIINEKYLHRGDFTLSSGCKSSLYFDIKGMLGDYYEALHLAEALVYKIRSIFADDVNDIPESEVGSIGGLELGGALIAALFVHEAKYNFVQNVCFIRKQQRIHGLKKMIEGCPKSKILLVDDVISTGETVTDAIQTCYDNGYQVAGVLCVINRWLGDMEAGCFNFYSERDKIGVTIPMYQLFKESDFE